MSEAIMESQKSPINARAKLIGKTGVGLAALISLMAGIHTYFFPRTEATTLQRQLDSQQKTIETVDSKYDTKIDELRDDIYELHSDVKTILFIEQRRANR